MNNPQADKGCRNVIHLRISVHATGNAHEGGNGHVHVVPAVDSACLKAGLFVATATFLKYRHDDLHSNRYEKRGKRCILILWSCFKSLNAEVCSISKPRTPAKIATIMPAMGRSVVAEGAPRPACFDEVLIVIKMIMEEIISVNEFVASEMTARLFDIRPAVIFMPSKKGIAGDQDYRCVAACAIHKW